MTPQDRSPIFTMPPHNFLPHHMVTTLKIGKWHYNCVLKGNLDDCFAGPSRRGVDAQSIVDGLLGRFGAGAGASDEHADTITGAGIGRNTSNIFYGTTLACSTIHQ